MEILKTEKFKTVATAIGAVVMYFTPPPYDAVITAILQLLEYQLLLSTRKRSVAAVSNI